MVFRLVGLKFKLMGLEEHFDETSKKISLGNVLFNITFAGKYKPAYRNKLSLVELFYQPPHATSDRRK